MSVLMEFAIFPTDKGDSVSAYLKEVMEYLDRLECPHQLTSMGSIVETRTMSEALEILHRCNQILEKDCNRIYMTAKFDNRKSDLGRMSGKVEKIQSLIQ